MTQYLLEIITERENLSCAALQSDVPGLGLDENGITWQDEDAPVKIEVRNDELSISQNRNFDGNLKLLRSGRTRQLRPGQSVRLLSEDKVCLGRKMFSVGAVVKSCTPKFEQIFHTFGTATRALMLTTAAALFITACSPFKTIDVDEKSAGDIVKLEPDVPSELDVVPEKAPEIEERLEGEPPEPAAAPEVAPEIEEALAGDVAAPVVVEPEVVQENSHPGSCGRNGNDNPAVEEKRIAPDAAPVVEEKVAGRIRRVEDNEVNPADEAPGKIALEDSCNGKSGKERRDCCETLDASNVSYLTYKNATVECCNRIKDSEYPCRDEKVPVLKENRTMGKMVLNGDKDNKNDE